ncbi:carboxy terminal-processing peptidase [Sphingobacterium sp. SRCM116780]|uniref:carboxy terminal-processing peptidase n=1 Tax=Sphingobacterium sp. SRCM116780 TaxID=2907623 RepID=UPI001F40800A|nr:carboxy terminal-processing peptidase [Sphingobacterium sp. SRCM116780]UIR54889.1 carboxy terminal-processing peptidase [Sphingobacterium sp. SRCM116780]
MKSTLKKLCTPLFGTLLLLNGISLSSYGQAIALLPEGFHFEPAPQHAVVTKTIADMIANYHYEKVTIDDAMSTKILDQYFSNVDKAKTLFLVSDIKEAEQYKRTLDDALRNGDPKPAFDLFSIYANRLTGKMDYCLNLLKTNELSQTGESFMRTREDMPRFTSLQEAQQYWAQQLHYEMLLLMSSQKSKEEARKLLVQRYDKVKKRVARLNNEHAFSLFLNAFTGAIDPHTNYLSPTVADGFNANMNKALVGIGVELMVQDEYPTIKALIKGGPAERSGTLAVNDRIVALADGEQGEYNDVVGWDLTEVADKIRGEKGSTLRLRVLPNTASLATQPQEIRIVRDKIVLEDQKAKSEVVSIGTGKRTKKIGVITIPNFYLDIAAQRKGDPNYASTSKDVRRILEELKKQHVDAVMVDLRNNGGGSMTEAIDLSGLFISRGPVVQLQDAKKQTTVFSDQDSTVAYSGPLTVLVNHFSASSSEIFAAAMQDYGRGVIIGEETYGKGTAQNTYPLSQLLKEPNQNLGQLNMTFSKFYRINGRSTQNLGVSPDILFPTLSLSIGERTLPNALKYDEIEVSKYTPVADLHKTITKLKSEHDGRMKNNLDYRFLLEDVQKLKEVMDQKTYVLDQDKFTALRVAQQEQQLNRMNQRRKNKGLKPLTSLVGQTIEKEDLMKEEALAVTAELSL